MSAPKEDFLIFNEVIYFNEASVSSLFVVVACAMEVLSAREVSLTHAEVLDFLKGEAKETKRQKHKQTGN